MKKLQNKKQSLDLRCRRYQLKIEGEEDALVSALREAERHLRSLSRNDDTEAGIEDEKDVWATKSNYYRQRLRTVRECLVRIRSGSFGLCASCGDEIGDKRLTAIPTALYCLGCQEAYERDRALAALEPQTIRA